MAIEVGQLLATIDSYNNTFTESEERIARIIQSEPDQIMYTVITELATKAKVADTTVTRFCKKLGFSGYSDFKLMLTQEIFQQKANHQAVAQEVTQSDETLDIIEKIALFNKKAIEETTLLLKPENIADVVKTINASSGLYFYGLGFSGFAAEEAKLKFLRTGLRADAFTDGHIMMMGAAVARPDDVIIGISYSGSSKDIVDALKTAKSRNAKTVAITHHQVSPVVKYADVVLLHGAKETYMQSGTLSTRAAQLFVIDVLYTEYCRSNGDTAFNARKATVRAIMDKMY